MQELLFWRKYRPKKLTGMVLLPRIRKYFENGFKQNVILHGPPGTGKSTLIEILLKDKNYIKINASIENGIDTLRDKITDFCDSMPSPFVKTDDKMKYVYLEEFDKTTDNFQDGFKAFVEKYDDRVRFIISMNDVNYVIAALQSRFQKISFIAENDSEKIYLMAGYEKYITSVAQHSGVIIDEDTIKQIVSKNYPDLRSSVKDLETIKITGNLSNNSLDVNYSEIFDFVLKSENDFERNFYYVMDNWVNNPKDLMNILGRPFYKYLIDNYKNVIKKGGFEILSLSKQYNSEFEMTVDPPLHLFSYICDLKTILSKYPYYDDLPF